MVQGRQKLAFGFEAANEIAVGKIPGHYFQGDLRLKMAVGPFGQIYRAHPAASEQPDGTVSAE